MNYNYITNDENYSKNSIEYAHDRVNYELSYSYIMDFTEKQIEWIKTHIYFSVRKAYNDGYNKHMEEYMEELENDDIFMENMEFEDNDLIEESYEENSELKIRIKYLDDSIERIKKIPQGDWIDLRSAVDVELKKEESTLIPLGVAMELPKGYEAYVVPRSSTFKKWGIIQTNLMGVIDEIYKGDDDFWFFPALAMRDTKIEKGDRICQFRIVEKMPSVEFEEVEFLGNKNRGGHGSTGSK